jgi:cytochrome P450
VSASARPALIRVGDPDLVRDVFRRVDEFPPHNALLAVTPLQPEALRILIGVGFALPPILASATGAQHRAARSVVAKFFTPAKVAAIVPRVVELTQARSAITGRRLAAGPVDLTDMIGRHVPPTIMADLIGSGMPDLDRLNRWSKDSLELFWGWPGPARQLELAHSAAALYTWLRDEVRARRDDDESLFGAMHRAGHPLTEICALAYFLMIAGQETTAQLISLALFRALQAPHEWCLLADDPTGDTAREFIRRILAAESSVPTWRRVAAHDTELGEAAIPAGAEILLELTGHHPADAGPTAYSLAFGHGVHRCLGARLAELEAATVLEHTARALPDVRLQDLDPGWLRLLSFQAPTSVIVERGVEGGVERADGRERA